MLKLLAVINVVFGVLLAGGSAYTALNAIRAAEPAPGGNVALIVFMGIMGIGFVFSAVVFLKNPNQRRALAVARNSAIFTWLSVALSIQSLTAGGSSSPVPFTVAVVAAGFAYFFVFKPAALREH